MMDAKAPSVSAQYPDWFFYPPSTAPPSWAAELVAVVSTVRTRIDSSTVRGVSSDDALVHMRPGLEQMGFVVETSKARVGKIHRPVLFGEKGIPLVNYEIDGWHEGHKIALEVEAGRGMKGNAFYRNLIRTPLIFDVEYLAVGLLREYHHKSGQKPTISRDYRDAKNQLDAIYASRRLTFPFKGILLFGY